MVGGGGSGEGGGGGGAGSAVVQRLLKMNANTCTCNLITKLYCGNSFLGNRPYGQQKVFDY